MGHIVSMLGQHRKAHRLLDSARRMQNAGVFIRMWTKSTVSLVDLQLGRLREATARFRIAVGSTHAFSYNLTSSNTWAGVLCASSVYQADDIQQTSAAMIARLFFGPRQPSANLSRCSCMVGFSVADEIPAQMIFHNLDAKHAPPS